MSVIVSTKLTIDDYINLRKLCERKGCSTYRITKDAIKEYLISQSEEELPSSLEKEPLKQVLEETPITEVVKAEPVIMDANELSESVRKLLERKSE